LADQKISELTALTGANVADDDAIAIVDTSATETKKIVFSELKNALDTATGFVRITGDTMTGALDVQSTITSDGLTVDGAIAFNSTATFSDGSEARFGADNDMALFHSSGVNHMRVNSGIFKLRADDMRFTAQNGTSNKLTLDSNGDLSLYEDTGTTAKFFWDASAESLGIGTSSPDTALHVAGNSTVRNTIVSNFTLDGGVQVPNPYDGFGFGIDFIGRDYGNAIRDYAYIYSVMEASGSSAGGGDASFTAGLRFYTNGGGASGTIPTERMRIDSSGRVGIGTDSPAVPLHVKVDTDENFYMSSDSGVRIQAMNDAGNAINTMKIGGNPLIFLGTGGTERMRIDSSGNVAIGLSSNIGAALHVDPATNVTTAFGTPLIKVGGANSWAGNGSIYSIGFGYNNGSTVKSPAEIGFDTTSATGVTKGDLVFATRDVTTDTAPTERMRIDSSGDLTVKGGRIFVNESDNGNTAIGLTRDADEGYVQVYSAGSITSSIRGNGDSYFNGGNVGIGTDSPSGILQVETSGTVANLYVKSDISTSALASRISLGNSTSAARFTFALLGGGGEIAYLGSEGSFPLYFQTAGTERMRIDSNGNVGIGVTPQTDWTSTITALQIGPQSVFRAGATEFTDATFMGTNVKQVSGTNKYIETGPATEYYQQNGLHFWNYAASGTAGNTISFSEAMRITSAGNVGIGASSSAQKLTISGGSSDVTMLWNSTDTAYHNFGIQKDGSLIKMGEFNNDGTTLAAAILNIEMNGDKVGIGTSSPEGLLHLKKTDTGISPQNPAGNQLVIENGDSSGSADLQFLAASNGYSHIFFGDAADANIGTILYAHTDNSLRFTTNTAEAMRIDSDGSAYWNTTVTTGYGQTTGDGNFAYANDDGSVQGSLLLVNNANRGWANAYWNKVAYTSGLDTRYFQFSVNGVAKGSINCNSAGTGVEYNTSSDRRLKENIQDLTNGIEAVKQLRPRTFDWITDEDNTFPSHGFIADEADDIVPELVNGEANAVDEDGNPVYQNMEYSKLVPLLTAALQEAITKIETLEARITALENA